MTAWRPEVLPSTRKARAQLLTGIRQFFAERDVLEVETPIWSSAGNSDPGIRQFHAESGHLRTSPEYPMKRLLADGSGDIFEMGRVFRQGERGARHNPEFTLLEWYRIGWSYHQLIRETTDLVMTMGRQFGQRWTAETQTYQALFMTHTGLDPLTAPTRLIQQRVLDSGLDLVADTPLDRDAWLDLLLTGVVEPALPADSVTVVVDYPPSQAALARIREDDPPVAERFELYLGGVELANGYQELTDHVTQRARFEAENTRRETPVILDERLLAALGHGLPECSGVALGVDRLLMACLGVEHINQVLEFPADQA